MREVLLETSLDSLKLLPFLFITFLLIELFEHKFTDKSRNLIEKSGKLGPLFGSILGIIPQCGFSVAATNLYVTRIISLGTLFSVYLSTSDEMIPLLIANNAPISLMVKILLIKLLFGMIIGFVIDLIIRKKDNINYEICADEHCNCHEGIFLASFKHTLNIFVFIFVSTFIINILLEYLGIENLQSLLLQNSVFCGIITCLIGLIPNCAASVVLTQLFLSEAISFGALTGGLLTGAGVALLVLLKENKNKKESIKILIMLYLIGVFSGIIIDVISKLV